MKSKENTFLPAACLAHRGRLVLAVLAVQLLAVDTHWQETEKPPSQPLPSTAKLVFTVVSYTSVVGKGIHNKLCKQFLNQQLNHSSYIPMLISVGINEPCSTLLAVMRF